MGLSTHTNHFWRIATALVCCVFTIPLTPSAADEAQWLNVIQSDAAPADKAIACKRLAIEGSRESIPALASLLSNPELSSWARIALEAIPDPAADAALRESLGQLSGNLLLGAINSLGVRGDAAAVDAIAAHLMSSDAQVAAGAAAALGKIGNDQASAKLRPLLTHDAIELRSAAAEGCVLCAEQMLAAERWQDATDLYDAVRKADVSRPRRQEATRGAILARQEAGIPLLLEQLQSPDIGWFRLGLTVARELPGAAVTTALANAVNQVSADRQPLLVLALADRSDKAVMPTVLKLAENGAVPVRIAAFSVLGAKGDVSCAPVLLEAAASSDMDLAQAAREALVALPGPDVAPWLTAQLNSASGTTRAALIALAGQRRLTAATPALLKASEDADAAIRVLALTSLGETVGPQDLHVLVERVTGAQAAQGSELEAARAALTAASIRMPDREACARQLTEALAQATVPAKRVVIGILGQMGGPTALQTLANAARDSQADLADDASRLLGEWMTEDAAPVLLELAKSAAEPKHQVRALRGYLRIARQFVLPDDQRIQMCRAAFSVAKRDDERKLILEILERYPTIDGLKLTTEIHKLPTLRDAAAQTGAAIAQKLEAAPAVAELLKQLGYAPVKLEILKAEYGANTNPRDVTDAMRKYVGNLTLVVLPSSYNAALGGDPAPGTQKQLKVQYRINNREGVATFAENSTILLPMP